ncbi:MAG: PCRF domain-containing protein [Candidatus Hermodarchaeia archaeon]
MLSSLCKNLNKLTTQENTMDSIIIEIRGAEGGTDSKLLAKDMAEVYIKASERRCL